MALLHAFGGLGTHDFRQLFSQPRNSISFGVRIRWSGRVWDDSLDQGPQS